MLFDSRYILAVYAEKRIQPIVDISNNDTSEYLFQDRTNFLFLFSVQPFYVELLIHVSQSKFSESRKFTLRYQYFQIKLNI